MALHKAEAFRMKITTSSDDINSAAENYNYTVHKPDPFTISGAVDDIQPFSPFGYACLDLATEITSPPIKSRGTFYIISVSERSTFDEEEFNNRRLAIKDRLFQQKLRTYAAYWFEKLREDADIQDNRAAF